MSAFKTFSHYVLPNKIKWVGGIIWLFETVVPVSLLKYFMKYFGYELVAVGRKVGKEGV